MSARFTRRGFAASVPFAAAALGGGASAAFAAAAPTAREVIGRIHAQLQSEGLSILPEGKTVDRFIVGNPDLPVRGIATAFMSTLDVLQRANAAGLSLIISHEPTFWNHLDDVSDLAGDPTYQVKKRYAEENGLTVWRFHDHWHRRKPDPISAALNRRLGIGAVSGIGTALEITPIRLGALVRRIEVALDTPNIRFWGDPERIVRRLSWGGHTLAQNAGRDGEVFLWPEPKEFNTFDYFRDANELGLDRSIIGATHELMEEWGMQGPCADWVRGFVPEVPVIPLRTAELYWTV